MLPDICILHVSIFNLTSQSSEHDEQRLSSFWPALPFEDRCVWAMCVGSPSTQEHAGQNVPGIESSASNLPAIDHCRWAAAAVCAALQDILALSTSPLGEAAAFRQEPGLQRNYRWDWQQTVALQVWLKRHPLRQLHLARHRGALAGLHS